MKNWGNIELRELEACNSFVHEVKGGSWGMGGSKNVRDRTGGGGGNGPTPKTKGKDAVPVRGTGRPVRGKW